MAHIAITGAAGNVGRILLDGFDDHEVTPLTYEEEDDMNSVVCDVTDREAFVDALAGRNVDVLIHLAGNPSPYADWDDLEEPNIDGVYNAYYAATENDLSRVVYASSNHAVNMDDIDEPDEPETMTENAPAVSIPIRPRDRIRSTESRRSPARRSGTTTPGAATSKPSMSGSAGS